MLIPFFCFIAITIDVGDPHDIHPRNKKTVGTRLALIALNKTYGKSDVRYSGPILENYKVEGTTVRLFFSNLESKLAVRDGGNSVSGFEIAGADGFFKPAAAIIQNNEADIQKQR
jgi:sialate O-acetylesterase